MTSNNFKSDEELIVIFQKGNNSAFDELFSRYKQPLLGYLERYMNNTTTAEDIFQQTFITLWTKRDYYKPTFLFKTWLYTIATNLARDNLKHKAIQKEIKIENMEQIPDNSNNHNKEVIETVKEVVEKLPEEQRQTFVLARYQELNYQEIAKICGCSLSAVKMRIHRALKTVTESLAGQL